MSYGSRYNPEGNEPDQIEFPGSGPGPRRRHGWLLPVLGVALVALVGGGAIAYAAEGSAGTPVTHASSAGQSSTPNASRSPSAPGWRGHFGGHFGGGFGGFGLGGPGFGGFGGAIHGQLTEPKSGGGYQTVDVQRGAVTAVSSTSITVKSADGYTATYAVTSSTEVNAQAAGIGTVKVGDNVDLVATVSNGKATAASIIDTTSIRASNGAFGFQAGPPAGNQS